MTTLREAFVDAGLKMSPRRKWKEKFYVCPTCGRDIVRGSYCPCKAQVVDIRKPYGILRKAVHA